MIIIIIIQCVLPNRSIRVANHSMRVAKAFNLRCKTIRCVMPNHSIRVAKPFDLRCKTIQCEFPNHSIRAAKSFNARFQTIRSALQNHSMRVSKPFEPRCQTIRSLINQLATYSLNTIALILKQTAYHNAVEFALIQINEGEQEV